MNAPPIEMAVHHTMRMNLPIEQTWLLYGRLTQLQSMEDAVVLALSMSGMKMSEIADEMEINEADARAIRQGALEQLGVKTKTEALWKLLKVNDLPQLPTTIAM